MPIIFLQHGTAYRLSTSAFVLETEMQEQIAGNPNILPLDEIRDRTEIVATVREFTVGAGPIDLLAFDSAGEVYVIETKLARNNDRRKVVAQVLDYGAALWAGFSDSAAFFDNVDDYLVRARKPTLLESLRSAHGGNESDASQARDRIAENLASGAVRFVISMDRVEDSLKDLVRFINENSRFTVYLIELEQYKHQDATIVVPKLFGAETRKQVASATARGTIGTPEAFAAELDRRFAAGELDQTEADAVRALLEIIAEQPAKHNWYSGAGGRVSVSPRFPGTGAETKSPFTLRSDGRLVLNAEYVGDLPAWRRWLEDVLALLGRPGDRRGFVEFRATEWTPSVADVAQSIRATASAAGGQRQ